MNGASRPPGAVVSITSNAAVYTVAEAAALLSIPTSTLYAWLRNGTLPGIKSAGRWGIPKSQLTRWLDAHTVPALPEHHKEAPTR
jgi:excisionase family DNA binding protein